MLERPRGQPLWQSPAPEVFRRGKLGTRSAGRLVRYGLSNSIDWSGFGFDVPGRNEGVPLFSQSLIRTDRSAQPLLKRRYVGGPAHMVRRNFRQQLDASAQNALLSLASPPLLGVLQSCNLLWRSLLHSKNSTTPGAFLMSAFFSQHVGMECVSLRGCCYYPSTGVVAG